MTNEEFINKINNLGKPINVLIDFSNNFYRFSFAMEKELSQTAYEDFRLIKHSLINNMLDFKAKFKDSNIVLCYDQKDDEGNYWRNNIHPNYKANRGGFSLIPKELLNKHMTEITEEIIDVLPWKSIRIKGVEADDIIGYLSSDILKEEISIIFSPDKDFTQLLSNDNIYLFDPLKDEFRECEDPRKDKFTMLIKGDTGDGIPNIFSDLDTLVVKSKRQTPVRQTKINEMWSVFNEKGLKEVANNYFDDNVKQRFIENRKLVDLLMIQDDIKKLIDDAYKFIKINGSKEKFAEYCNKNRLIKISARVNEL